MKKKLPPRYLDGKWFELWYRSYKKLRVPSDDLYDMVTLKSLSPGRLIICLVTVW